MLRLTVDVLKESKNMSGLQQRSPTGSRENMDSTETGNAVRNPMLNGTGTGGKPSSAFMKSMELAKSAGTDYDHRSSKCCADINDLQIYRGFSFF